MALSEQTILMNFQEANRQAGRLEEIAADIMNVSDRDLEEEIRTISVSWKGENADAFVGKTNMIKDKTKKSAQDLQKIAKTIRTIAKNTYDAEMRATEIAKNDAGSTM